jgi:hypothetical protein
MMKTNAVVMQPKPLEFQCRKQVGPATYWKFTLYEDGDDFVAYIVDPEFSGMYEVCLTEDEVKKLSEAIEQRFGPAHRGNTDLAPVFSLPAAKEARQLNRKQRPSRRCVARAEGLLVFELSQQHSKERRTFRTTFSLREKPLADVSTYTVGISFSKKKDTLGCKPEVEVNHVLDLTGDDVLDLNDAIKERFGL